MSLEAMRDDQATCRRTERRTLTTSAAVHALLLFLLIRMGPSDTGPGGDLTEVSLLEPAGGGGPPRAAAPALPATPAPTTQPGVLVRKAETRFQRSDEGDFKPEAQSKDAFEDRMNERLATMQREATPSLAGLGTVAPRIPELASPTGLPGGTGTGGSSALSLRRTGPDGGGGSGPLELARGGPGGGGGSGRGIGLAQLPAEKAATRASSPPPKAVARQSLAGVSLAGPIADRPVLEAVRPEYPEWAKAEAVEGSVTLYFVVLPDGTVKPNVLVQKTAGFGDFDDNAVAALSAWRFAPLPAGRTGDQWGTITFHYRLSEAH